MEKYNIDVDVVYIVTKETNEIEFKYSLRSLEKYGQNISNVFIVGDWPEYLDYNRFKFIHLDLNLIKENNLYHALVSVCNNQDLSKYFILMDSDQYLLQTVEMNNFPYYHHISDLKQIVLSDPEKRFTMENRARLNTHNALMSRQLPTKSFDAHYPFLIYKDLFLEIMSKYNWTNKNPGYLVKSLYVNSVCLDGIEIEDSIEAGYELANLNEYLNDSLCFSSNHELYNSTSVNTQYLFEYLDAMFSEKCKYEI